MNLNALMESLRSASPYRILFDEICDKSSTVAKTQVIAEAVPFLLATLRKSLELNSKHVPSYIALAGIYKKLGQHDAALAAFEAAAKANPGNSGSARGKLYAK